MQRILPRADFDSDLNRLANGNLHASSPDRNGHRYLDAYPRPDLYRLPRPNADVGLSRA